MKQNLELKISIIIISFSLLNFFYLIPTQIIAEGSSPVYPYLVNTILTIFSLGYLLESFLATRKQTAAQDLQKELIEKTEERKETFKIDKLFSENSRKALQVLSLFGLMAAWFWTLEMLGFMLSAFIFLVFCSIIYGAKSPIKIGLLSIGMPLIFHLIFWLLGTALPEGPLEELMISILY